MRTFLWAFVGRGAPVEILARATVLGTLFLVGVDVTAAVLESGRRLDANGPLPETITTAPGYNDLEPAAGGDEAANARPSPGDHVRPYSPIARPASPGAGPPVAPMDDGPVPTYDTAMQFTFREYGEGAAYIVASGAIAPGAASAFAAFDMAHGRRANLVILDSPGGVMVEAIEMGLYIRERRMETMVAPNGLCASACPLTFAGGTRRIAFETSWIGVHRAFITQRGIGDTLEGLRQGQQLAAACMEHLESLGIDPVAWMPALSTPWNEIYFFSSDQLKSLRLATEVQSHAA